MININVENYVNNYFRNFINGKTYTVRVNMKLNKTHKLLVIEIAQ